MLKVAWKWVGLAVYINKLKFETIPDSLSLGPSR